jgi:hypothetical protein
VKRSEKGEKIRIYPHWFSRTTGSRFLIWVISLTRFITRRRGTKQLVEMQHHMELLYKNNMLK